MNVIIDKNIDKERPFKPSETLMLIEQVLKEAVLTGKIGSLRVDPSYLVVKPPIGESIYFFN